MSEDIERRLRQLTPIGAPPELRARVLVAVADELRTQPVPPAPLLRSLRPAFAIAAGVLAGLGLNLWVNDRLDRRLAIVLGPPPVRRQAAEIADDVASITDPATGRWIYQRLAASRPDPDETRRYAARLRRLIRELTLNHGETADAALQEDPQSGRDHHGSRDRHPADPQRPLRLANRDTA
jgi:hypothetical protein